MTFNLFFILLIGVVNAHSLPSSNEFIDYDDFKIKVYLEDNPGLARQFVVDIASSASFVVAADKEETLPTDVVFNERRSKTYKELGCFTVRYPPNVNTFSGGCNGVYGSDLISLNKVQKISTRFGICKSVYGHPTAGLTRELYAGKIGFGPGAEPKESSVRSDLMKSWMEPVLCLATNNKRGFGERVVIQGRNVADASNTIVQIQPSTRNGHWRFPASFNIGSTKFPTINAVLSTTSHQIILPTSLYHEVAKAFDAIIKKDRYYLDCKKEYPGLELQINGKIVEIPAKHLMEQDEDRCELFIRKSVLDYMVIGSPLLVQNGLCLNFDTKAVTIFRNDF